MLVAQILVQLDHLHIGGAYLLGGIVEAPTECYVDDVIALVVKDRDRGGHFLYPVVAVKGKYTTLLTSFSR